MPPTHSTPNYKWIRWVERLFGKLPSPFTLAVLLTLVTFVLAWSFTTPPDNTSAPVHLLQLWAQGIWNVPMLVFAYQMMLILVLGHLLVMSKPMHVLLNRLGSWAPTTAHAVVLVSISTLLVAFFNWGLGLIFGAVLTRKIGENALARQQPINYPLVGAAGYVGLMVWHGGISGSAPLKAAEQGHFQQLVGDIKPHLAEILPDSISTAYTIFSIPNLLIFLVLLLVVPLFFRLLAAKTPQVLPPAVIATTLSSPDKDNTPKKGLENTFWLSKFFGGLVLLAFIFQYGKDLSSLNFTPNMLNFFMLGLALVLHRNISAFLAALDEAVKGVSGILIQFPLYFGIMGVMAGSGLAERFSDAIVSVSTSSTLPVYTFFSAGLLNIFIPSGGGQWAIQGPIVLDAANQLGVPLPKAIMALAYGDQITNMLQPFWALPLLSITQLKAREILPYTFLMMLAGCGVFIIGLLLW